MFDETSHPCLRDAPPTKELHCIPRRILRASSTVHFQERDLACEFRRLLLVRLKLNSHSRDLDATLMSSERSLHHIAHLVRDVLKPRLHGFCARDHLRQLGADDRL